MSKTKMTKFSVTVPDTVILEVHGAYTTTDERGALGQCKGWYSSKDAAVSAASGLGWYGGNGAVVSKPSLVLDGKVYLLAQPEPIVVDPPAEQFTPERLAALRKSAAQKLTADERRAMGLA